MGIHVSWSAFTSKKFSEFSRKANIKHVLNAVATPRANGQAERFNRTLKTVLLTTCPEEDRWDSYLHRVQFAINNVISKSTGKTASELLHGFRPRGGIDALLTDEISELPRMIEDIVAVRQTVGEKLRRNSDKQKARFDQKRKKAREYKEGDLVVIEKQEPSSSTSRKMILPYSGPMVVKKILPNDRYIVCDMPGSFRTSRKSTYENVVVVDHMKPWQMSGDDTDQESGSDGVPLSDDDDQTETDERLTEASGRV